MTIDTGVPSLPSIAALRLLTAATTVDTVRVIGWHNGSRVGGGIFVRDTTDTTSTDDAGTIIVDSVGRRWKRIYTELSSLIFGCHGDGVTDDRLLLKNACDVAASTPTGFLRLDAVDHYCSNIIDLPSYLTLAGYGIRSKITISGGVSGLKGNAKTQINIRDLRVSCASSSATAYIGGIFLDAGCSYCAIERVQVDGMSFGGIYCRDLNHSIISDCYVPSKLGTNGSSFGIGVFRDSNFNIIRGNRVYANTVFGIAVQDPYEDGTPTGNQVINNQVSASTGYGIIVYTPSAFDSRTLVMGNTVRDVTGAAISGASGAGIYIAAAGGTRVIGNNVSNCLLSTSDWATLFMAHISVNTSDRGGDAEHPIIVEGNQINATRGPGISCSVSRRGVTIANNVIRSSATQTSVPSSAITINNADKCKISGNNITHVHPEYPAIWARAVAKALVGLTIVNNTAEINGSLGFITIARVTSGGWTRGTVSGNVATLGSGSAAITISNFDRARITDNFASYSGVTFQLTNCLKAVMSGNQFFGTNAAASVVFSGTCTGSSFDQTNDLDTIVMNNATGSGVRVTQYGTAAPAAGTWRAGDRIEYLAPAAGASPGSRCTTAGTPGTWKAEAAIAA